MLDNLDQIETVAQRSPLETAASYREARAGMTVAEIVAQHDLPKRFGLPSVVMVRGGHHWPVPADMWGKVKPKYGTRIEIGYPVRGPAVALVASAVVSAAAPAIAGGIAGFLGVTSAFGIALITAGVSIVGGLLVQALIPPPSQDRASPRQSDAQNFAITGTRNVENRYGIYPKVLGRHRVFPPKSARGYTETVGTDIYYRGRIAVGWGPVALSDLKIGTTPITQFDGIELEFLNVDRAETQALSPELTDASVVTEQAGDAISPVVDGGYLGAEATGYVVKTSPARTVAVDLDIAFDGGVTDGGAVLIEWRKVGLNEWQSANQTFTGAGPFTASIGLPEAGDYEVRVGRPSDLTDPDNVTLTELRWSARGLVRGWRQGTEPLELMSNNIFEDPYNVKLTKDDPVIRNTRERTKSAAVDVTFPQGMAFFVNGVNQGNGAEFGFAYRKVGNLTWTDAGTENYRGATTAMRRFTKQIDFPEEGEWEIKITRLTNDASNQAGDLRDAFLSGVRSIRGGDLPSHDGIAEVAFRLKASDQLNGAVDTLNLIAHQMAPVWDGSAWTAPQRVRHPAWVMVDALRGPHLRRPVADSRIDLAALKAWADEEPHWTVDKVIDQPQQLSEVLDMICATGRAKKTLADLLYSVIRDGAAGPVRQVFTPRNSWGFKGQVAFPREIHGFRVKVVSERMDWQQDEIIVYADGYNASNATELETMDLPGVVLTSADVKSGNAYRLARYHLAQAILRPEVFEWHSDWEAMRSARGTKVRLVHDVPSVGLGQGRIKSIDASGGTLTAITLDERVTVEAGTYRLSVQCSDGEVRAFEASVTVGGEVTTWTRSSGDIDPADIALGNLVAIEQAEQESLEVLITGVWPDSDGSARITAVPAAPEVLNADQGVIPDYEPVVTDPVGDTYFGPPKPVVTSIRSDQTTALVERGGTLQARIAVFLQSRADKGETADKVQLRWRRTDDSEWQDGPLEPAGVAALYTGALEVGSAYAVEVRSVDAQGRSRGWVTAGVITAVVRDAPPPDVTGFAIEMEESFGSLSWDDPDVLDLDFAEIRFTDIGQAWEDAEVVVRVTYPRVTKDIFARVGTYMIKWADRGRQYSETEATLTVTQLMVADGLREEIRTAFERHDQALETLNSGAVFDLLNEVRIQDAIGLAQEVTGKAQQVVAFEETGDNAAAIVTEQIARADADSAIASDVTALTSRVGNNESNISDIQTTKVDANGAIAAVETQISAEYNGLSAMASATGFAEATADKIEAGYVWRLNNQNLLELVSVQDGVDTGPTSTFKIDADYVQITGLTQIDQAVINNIAADTGFISNLSVDTLNIAENAVTIPFIERLTNDVLGNGSYQNIHSLNYTLPQAGTVIFMWNATQGYDAGAVPARVELLVNGSLKSAREGDEVNSSPTLIAAGTYLPGTLNIVVRWRGDTSGVRVGDRSLTILGAMK